MKRIVSVVGARPNFMKVAPLHRAFRQYSGKVEHLLVHTGQHYDVNMSDTFFQDLEMPQPAYFLGFGHKGDRLAKRLSGLFTTCCSLSLIQLRWLFGRIRDAIHCQ